MVGHKDTKHLSIWMPFVCLASSFKSSLHWGGTWIFWVKKPPPLVVRCALPRNAAVIPMSIYFEEFGWSRGNFFLSIVSCCCIDTYPLPRGIIPPEKAPILGQDWISWLSVKPPLDFTGTSLALSAFLFKGAFQHHDDPTPPSLTDGRANCERNIWRRVGWGHLPQFFWPEIQK